MRTSSSTAAAPPRVTNTFGRTRRRRTARVAVATMMVSVVALSAGPAVAEAATVSTTSARLVDWGSPFSGSGGFGGDDQQGRGQAWGDGSSGSGIASTTVDSTTATAAQAKGVVLIDTVLTYEDATAAGTGIVLTSSGQVLTNYHVVEGATSISVTIASTGKTYRATVVGHDQTDDVALLQLRNASGLATATIDDDTVAMGDAVTAVGNAGGTNTLTAAAGTVTSLSTTITTASEGSTAGETLHHLIETSADVVAGDSGGPLYDSQGEVVGIDTAASSGIEINGYAIAIDRALAVVTQIRSGAETAGVQVGAAAYLGVEISSVTASSGDGSDAGYAAGANGALIAGVVADGPAAKAGLVAGDTITAIGGRSISSASQVSTRLEAYDPGDRVSVVWTDSSGTSHTATVALGSSPIA